MIGLYTKEENGRINVYFGDHAIHLGFFYQEVDGFYVFDPNKTLDGVYNEHLLKFLADTIYELNKDWNQYIQKNIK